MRGTKLTCSVGPADCSGSTVVSLKSATALTASCLAGSWDLGDLWENQWQYRIMRVWKSMDKEEGQSYSGEKDRNTGSSFKKPGDYLLASYLCEQLTGCVVYLLLLSSSIFYSKDIHYLFLKKTNCLLLSQFYFLVWNLDWLKKRIEKTTAVAPFYMAFFQWTFKMWQTF